MELYEFTATNLEKFEKCFSALKATSISIELICTHEIEVMCATRVSIWHEHHAIEIFMRQAFSDFASIIPACKKFLCIHNSYTLRPRDLRDLEILGLSGSSIPKALLGGPRVSKLRRSCLFQCLTILDHG